MKKRIVSALAAVALTLGLGGNMALAYESSESLLLRFPATKTYPGFADVQEKDWYYSNAKLCYEIGLMEGTNLGFEPQKTLSQIETVVLAARLKLAYTRAPIPEQKEGERWYQRYLDYLAQELAGTAIIPDAVSTRGQFLELLGQVMDLSTLYPYNEVDSLPDTDSETVLAFFRAGILNGLADGTFGGDKTLTRAEAAAMISRIARNELKIGYVPEEPSQPDSGESVPVDMALALKAAYMDANTVVFEGGVTAEEFLKWVNTHIANEEAGAARGGREFNWHYEDLNGKTTLENVKAAVLEALGVTEGQGTEAYKDFDYQVYYARLIDLTGETLEPDYGVKSGGMS